MRRDRRRRRRGTRYVSPMAGRLAGYGGPPPRRISLTVLVGRNWHTASASVLAISVCCGPSTEPSCVRISSMTALWVSASFRSMYSLARHGEGVRRRRNVRRGARRRRAGRARQPWDRRQPRNRRQARYRRQPGIDGVEVRGVEVPGSVVIATVPGVVRSQAVMPAASTSVAPAIRTRVLICATIGAPASDMALRRVEGRSSRSGRPAIPPCRS